MKVLVLSDIHGNLEALKAVLNDAEKMKPKEIWFLGDLSGYGPEPEKCFQLLKSYKIVFIPGNHDLYFAGQLSRDAFSTEALTALILTGSMLHRDFIQLIKDLPLKQQRKGVTLVHGSPVNPATDYILHIDEAEIAFKKFKGRCCLFGHTHHQGYFFKTAGNIRWYKPELVESVQYGTGRILINPGSVGQPRDRDPRAAWAILDTGKKEVQFFRSDYNIEKTQEKMRALGSSDFLINRLEKGI